MTHSTAPQTAQNAQQELNTRGIEAIRTYVESNSHGADLAGYAAQDAERVLLANWTRAVADVSKDPLLDDIDQVIANLQVFRAEAAKHLPVVNGGLAGLTLEAWKIRLENMDVEIYPCPQHRISRFGYTGCDDADYTSEADAIKAAVAHHFG